jgi:hypothetical protein
MSVEKREVEGARRREARGRRRGRLCLVLLSLLEKKSTERHFIYNETI